MKTCRYVFCNIDCDPQVTFYRQHLSREVYFHSKQHLIGWIPEKRCPRSGFVGRVTGQLVRQRGRVSTGTAGSHPRWSLTYQVYVHFANFSFYEYTGYKL